MRTIGLFFIITLTIINHFILFSKAQPNDYQEYENDLSNDINVNLIRDAGIDLDKRQNTDDNNDDNNNDDNNNNNNNDNNEQSSNTSNSGTSTRTSSSTASETESETAPSCGASPGAFFFTYPYTTTIGIVGDVLQIKWNYTQFTDVGRFPSNFISLYYQDTNGINNLNWIRITDSIPRSANNYNWTIPSLTDSSYKVRINADNIDPALDKSVLCIPDGFPSPSNTQAFHIVNALPLQNTNSNSNNFGPHSGADSINGNYFLLNPFKFSNLNAVFMTWSIVISFSIYYLNKFIIF